MTKINEVKQERFDEVVAKFQKYGIGLVMTGYIGADAANATLWHELVYPNRVTGKHAFELDRLKTKFLQLFKKASEVSGLAEALGDEEIGPDVVFSVLDEFSKNINVTWEELALFAYAAYKSRKESDDFAKELAKVKDAQDNIKKNLSVKERRKLDEKLVEDFKAKHGSDLLDDDI